MTQSFQRNMVMKLPLTPPTMMRATKHQACQALMRARIRPRSTRSIKLLIKQKGKRENFSKSSMSISVTLLHQLSVKALTRSTYRKRVISHIPTWVIIRESQVILQMSSWRKKLSKMMILIQLPLLALLCSQRTQTRPHIWSSQIYLP
jgi:hypothetical protein